MCLSTRWTAVRAARAALVLMAAATLCAAIPLAGDTSRAAEVARTPNAAPVTTRAPWTAPGQSATRLSDGRWLLVGGRSGGSPSNAVIVEGTSSQAAPALSLRYPRSGHTATVLPDGSVAVVGGVGRNGQIVPQIEIVDVVQSETRVAAEVALLPRANHTATLLTDGRVLVAGGASATGAPRADAQLWNPQTGVVETVDGFLAVAREGHNAALLADGSVLITGGKDARGATVTDADRFDSTTGLFSGLTASEEAAVSLSNRDARPPAVEAVLPVADASDAPVDTRVAIRLSRPVDASAIVDGTVTVVGPAGAAQGQLAVAEGGRLLFFTPSADLLPNATYTVFVKGAFPMTTSTFTTKALTSEPRSRQAVVTAEGRISLEITQDESQSPRREANAKERASGEKPVQKPKDARKPEADEEDDGDEIEDWLPGPEHRRGNWRVIGLRHEPRTKRPIVAPAQLDAASRMTALTGRVVRLNGRPIAKVPVRVGAISTQTDEHGRFLLSGVPQGSQVLLVEGSRVQRGGRSYLTHYVRVDVVKGKTTRIGEPIYLAREDRDHAVSFSSPTDREVVVTNPAIPGLELHIPKGAVIRTPDGKIVTKLSITALPVNRAPFPVPMSFPVYFSVQPAGAFVDNSGSPEVRGIRVLYPNYINAPPGTRVAFWNYDPNGEGWQVYGGGTVSPDGQKVVPDEGVTQATLMAFGYGLENQGRDPNEGPPPGGCVTGGDPVDCATGLFLHSSVDLYVKDTTPIVLSRTYRQNDSVSRDFGIGANHSYGMFLSNPTTNTSAPEMVDLILPDGGRVRFSKISGSGTDTLYEHSATPTGYYGARLQVNTVTQAWEVTLRDKTALQFQRHSPNQLIGICDRLGNTIKINRTGDLISQVISPHGRTLSFSYDSGKRITQVMDNAGRAVRYQYDASGRLWKVTDPDGKVEQYGYDSSNRMTTVTDRRGNAMVTNVYDSNGRVQQQTLADGAVWQFAYQLDLNGRVQQTDVTNPRGFIRRVKFNSAGYLTEQTWALGQPEQRTSTYVREPITRLILSATDHLGRVTKYTYDHTGQTTSVTSLFGTAEAVTESFGYDAVTGLLTSHTDPLNQQSQFNYDSNRNLVSIVGPLGRSFSATYDSEGNVTFMTDALGRTSQLVYEQGDLASTTNPLGQTSQHFTDQLGRRTGYSDPAGRNARVTYDSLDRVTQVTDALGQTSVSTYDEKGNLRTFRDPRNAAVHAFTYDARNRVHTYTDPLSAIEVYEYDGMGNLTSKTDRKGQLTSFTYDPLNRLKTVTYADSSTITLTWDDASRRVILADSANGTITQTYDDLGRLVRESGPEGQVDYAYDAAGRRTQMIIAGVATPIIYQYDAANRLTQVAQGAVATVFGYDAADRRTSTTLPNGVISTWTYSDADEITAINYDRGGTHIGELSYTYDGAGRRVGVSGSLAKLGMPASVTAATYDAANRLTSWDGSSLTYDNNGNLASHGSATYTWNARDQLTATNEGASGFSYDAVGRRRSRTVSGATTPYLHDEVNPVQVGGNVMLAGLGVDEFYAQIAGGVPTSYLGDALGSTVALSDAGGASTANFAYEPYGASASTGSADTSFRFTGREDDGSSNLHYFRARYYSPQLGRFISEDPIGLAGGPNRYAYAAGAPTNFTDRMGLFVDSVRATCVQDPEFCAEILGIMVQNAGAASGDPCIAEQADELAGKILVAGAALGVIGVASVARGAARGAAETTRVGRWMSKAEFNQMSTTGKVVEGAGGRTSVIRPPNPSSYTAAPPGSVYAEFNVPSGVLRQGGKPDWAIIPGPNVTTRIFGPPPAQMPPATCIVCVIGN